VNPTDSNRISVSGDRLPPELARSILYLAMGVGCGTRLSSYLGGVAELVGIEGGVVSGVINLESSGVEASDWRPRHDEQYDEV
jgi:hypothetical protein